jgi:hypothetical protein
MAHEFNAGTGDEPARRRPRGRRVAFVTLVMAGAYLWGADVALNGGQRWGLSWEGLRRINSARAIMMTLAPPPALRSQADGVRPAFGGIFPLAIVPQPAGASPTDDSEQIRASHRHVREVAAVEGAAWVWQRMVWGLCGLLAVVALLSWITPWGRAWHLVAALPILLVAFLSVASLRYLEIPDGQGMALWPLKPEWYTALTQRWGIPEGGGLPPLPARTYLVFGTVMSAYGWLLIGLFARRAVPEPLSEPNPISEQI